MKIPLTSEEIERDILEYEVRLSKAEARLNDLPQKVSTWKERNKIREARRVLLSEIRHVRTLIHYAEQALAEVAR